SFESLEAISQWRADVRGGRNPRDIKVAFAQEIVGRFHGAEAAGQALADFETRFRQNEIPDDIPEVNVACEADGMPIAAVLKQAGLTASTSDALRMLAQGGVKMDGNKISDKGLK